MDTFIEKLKWFQSNLDLNYLPDFDSLIEEIKKQLPEHYSFRFGSLSFYSIEDDDTSDELPF